MNVIDIGNMVLNAKQERLSDYAMVAIMAALIASRADEKPVLNTAAMIIKNRLKEHGFGHVADDSAIMYFGNIADRPGIAILYAAALVAAYYRQNERQVTLEDICTEHFAIGFPTNDSLLEVWDKQKDGGSNLLDRATTWEVYNKEMLS